MVFIVIVTVAGIIIVAFILLIFRVCYRYNFRNPGNIVLSAIITQQFSPIYAAIGIAKVNEKFLLKSVKRVGPCVQAFKSVLSWISTNEVNKNYRSIRFCIKQRVKSLYRPNK